MTDASDLSLLTTLALPLRLAAAFATLWCGVLLALVVAQRSDGTDARVQRSWLVTAGGIVGACLWAGQLCLVLALGGVATLPLGGATLTLGLAIGLAGATLAGGLSPRRVHHGAAVAGGALLMLAGIAAWVQVLDWKTPALPVAAASVLAVAA